jgi:hypothetical protein
MKDEEAADEPERRAMRTGNEHICAACGFLSLRDASSRQLVEVEAIIREDGRIPQVWGQQTGFQDMYPPWPICFQRAWPLMEEMRAALTLFPNAPQQEKTTLAMNKVINLKRPCLGFTPWQQGFTPKEHRERLDREWKLKFETEQRRKDEEWRSAESKAASDRHAEQMRELKGQGRTLFWILGVAIFLATI